MFLKEVWILATVVFVSNIYASPIRKNPYDAVYHLREGQKDHLAIDLGYAIYQGYTSTNTSINIWKSIRYAAPPLGKLRFQAPNVPEIDRDSIQYADSDGMQCPPTSWTGSGGMNGSEDCMFLNVFSPQDAKGLPVFVYIHGGGYERGNASLFEPEAIMNTNDHGFVSVIIQYRVGAFGFLASEEVKSKGELNVGLLDQRLTLQWVQRYISLFGGDPTRVTLAGQSAGGGSIMHHAIAFGGQDKEDLWNNGITASPFLPQEYHYLDEEVRSYYLAFAEKAGCGGAVSTFECLQEANTENLIFAHNELGKTALWGLYTWKPVVDGTLIPSRPSRALLGKVNGKRILTGNNAEEGWLFTPQNITTRPLFIEYLRRYFPRLTDNQISSILRVYNTPEIPDEPNKARYWTSGTSGVTAVNQSGLAAGHQQVANNFYGEVTFFCPSYWLAEAFQNQGDAYQYQYSVIPSYHGADIPVYVPDESEPINTVLQEDFQRAWGSFIITDKPSDWPRRTALEPMMQNLNLTGGTPVDTKLDENLTVKKLEGPGIATDFTKVNADTWEGGRGPRCRFIRTLAENLVI